MNDGKAPTFIRDRVQVDGRADARSRVRQFTDPGSFTEFGSRARHRTHAFGMQHKRPAGRHRDRAGRRPGGRRVRAGFGGTRRFPGRGPRRQDRPHRRPRRPGRNCCRVGGRKRWRPPSRRWRRDQPANKIASSGPWIAPSASTRCGKETDSSRSASRSRCCATPSSRSVPGWPPAAWCASVTMCSSSNSATPARAGRQRGSTGAGDPPQGRAGLDRAASRVASYGVEPASPVLDGLPREARFATEAMLWDFERLYESSASGRRQAASAGRLRAPAR